jgi:hypothetical protein
MIHRAALVRLASFVLVIAGSFGTAYGIGRKLPGNPESRPHTHGPQKPSLIPPGFAVDGYELVIEASRPSAATLALHVKGPDGERVTRYTESQGSTMHVVLVRPDLSGFQHIHVDINTDGSFVVPVDQHGKWHIIVDAQPVGATKPIVLATNIDDEVPVETVSVPQPKDTIKVNDLTVARRGLDFVVTSKDGSSPSGLEPYLGQPAQLIALHKDDLAYTHLQLVDPVAGSTFSFSGTLARGTDRLFLEFGYRGKVVTASFTVVQP